MVNNPLACLIFIDAGDLIMALEDHGGTATHFLDIQTGEVIRLSADGYREEEDEELAEKIEEEYLVRYIRIDPIDSSAGFQIMADFVESLSDARIVDRLARALSGTKPFRRFKDALHSYPELREPWFGFKDQEMLKLARVWLENSEISFELTGRLVKS